MPRPCRSGVGDPNPTSNFKGSTIPRRHRGRAAVPAVLAQGAAERPGLDGFKDASPSATPAARCSLLSLTNNTGETDLNFYTGGSTFAGTLAFGARTTRWLRISLTDHTGAPTTTDAYR